MLNFEQNRSDSLRGKPMSAKLRIRNSIQNIPKNVQTVGDFFNWMRLRGGKFAYIMKDPRMIL